MGVAIAIFWLAILGFLVGVHALEIRRKRMDNGRSLVVEEPTADPHTVNLWTFDLWGSSYGRLSVGAYSVDAAGLQRAGPVSEYLLRRQSGKWDVFPVDGELGNDWAPLRPDIGKDLEAHCQRFQSLADKPAA